MLLFLENGGDIKENMSQPHWNGRRTQNLENRYRRAGIARAVASGVL